MNTNSHKPFAGQPIFIPGSHHIHVAQVGETLEYIAEIYKQDLAELIAVNGLHLPSAVQDNTFVQLLPHIQPISLVSIIIPLYNESRHVSELCQAIQNQTYSHIEVLLIDAGSTDNTIEIAANYFPVMCCNQRIQSYTARNLGIRNARGSYLIFTDGDCIPRSDWVERLVRKLDQGYDTVAGDTHAVLWSQSVMCRAFLEEAPRAWLEYAGGQVTAWFPTCNVAYRRTVFERLGLFQEHNTGSDVLFSKKAGEAGFSCAIEPMAVVDHYYAQGYNEILQKWLRYGEKRQMNGRRLAFAIAQISLFPFHLVDSIIKRSFSQDIINNFIENVLIKSCIKTVHQLFDTIGSARGCLKRKKHYSQTQLLVSNESYSTPKTSSVLPTSKEYLLKAKASIIVPLYNEGRHVRSLCEALQIQTYQNIQVILVDNGSTDNTVSIASEYFDVFKCPNPGSYHARNVGLASASGEYILFTDGDCVPHPLWVEQMVTSLSDGYDVVAGSTLGIDFHNNTICQELVRGSLAKMAFKGTKATCYFPTCNVSYRRTVFEKLGYFRNYSGSDTRFSQEAFKAGFRCIIDPKSIVYHHIADSYWELCQRWFRAANHRNLKWYGIISAILRIGFLPVSLIISAVNELFEADVVNKQILQEIMARLIRKLFVDIFFSSGAIYARIKPPRRVF